MKRITSLSAKARTRGAQGGARSQLLLLAAALVVHVGYFGAWISRLSDGGSEAASMALLVPIYLLLAKALCWSGLRVSSAGPRWVGVAHGILMLMVMALDGIALA